VLVLLPPSETKAHGGDGPPLDLDALGFPTLNPLRDTLVDALVELAADTDASLAALGLGPKQAGELASNAVLRSAGTAAALDRYTGVLYDALDAARFTRAQRARASARLAVGSALFGALRAGDPIPRYRLSGGSTLPDVGGLRTLWRPILSPALSRVEGLVVDLRSGSYAALGPVTGAVTATVLTEKPDGSRAVVSHFNKAHKGLLARALALTRAEPTDVRGVAQVARRAGLRVEIDSDTALTVLT
jgi:uncharacterized protein